MSQKLGSISDYELEQEVKRCYRSLLEAQETTSDCERTHDEINRVMNDPKEEEYIYSKRWKYISPREIYKGSQKMEEEFYNIDLSKFQIPKYTSPLQRYGKALPVSSYAPKIRNDRPKPEPSYKPPQVNLDTSYDEQIQPKNSEENVDDLDDDDTSYSLPAVNDMDDEKLEFNGLSSIGDTSLTSDIISKEIEANNADGEGKTSLHYAAQLGQIARLQVLLENGAIVNAVDNYGKSPLIYAVEQGYSVFARELLERGAYVNQKDKKRNTPLKLATENGRKALVELLLRNRASVFILDDEMKAPLHYAVEQNYPDVVETLLDYGAPGNQSDGNQRKPLHYASEGGFLSILDLLIGKGASIDTMDKELRTPLFLAVDKGLEIISHTLIRKGASVNASNRFRQTPLHVAAGKGLLHIALDLMDNKSSVDGRDDSGKTPIFYAVQCKDINMINALLQHGAQVDVCDIMGKSLLRYAVEAKNNDITYLISKTELKKLPKRYVFHRQLLTAIEMGDDFLGKTVWNHVIDRCIQSSSSAVEYRIMTSTVEILLDMTCNAFSKAYKDVLIKVNPEMRNGKPETPSLVAHAFSLPSGKSLNYMGVPVIYKLNESKIA